MGAYSFRVIYFAPKWVDREGGRKQVTYTTPDGETVPVFMFVDVRLHDSWESALTDRNWCLAHLDEILPMNAEQPDDPNDLRRVEVTAIAYDAKANPPPAKPARPEPPNYVDHTEPRDRP